MTVNVSHLPTRRPTGRRFDMRVRILTVLGILGIAACGSSGPQSGARGGPEQTASYGAGDETLTVTADSLAQGADGLFTIHYRGQGGQVDIPINVRDKVIQGFLTTDGVPFELVQSAIADARAHAEIAKSQELQTWYRLQTGVFLLGVEKETHPTAASNPSAGDLHIQANVTGPGGDCSDQCVTCYYLCPEGSEYYCCDGWCGGCEYVGEIPDGLCSAATATYCK
jgi:hypothetical protein